MNAVVNTVPVAVLILAIVVIVIFGIFPRVKGLHFTSSPTCPKCSHRYEYNWVPGGALEFVVRWGKYRLMQCPRCGQWSWFDIWSTRIDSGK